MIVSVDFAALAVGFDQLGLSFYYIYSIDIGPIIIAVFCFAVQITVYCVGIDLICILCSRACVVDISFDFTVRFIVCPFTIIVVMVYVSGKPVVNYGNPDSFSAALVVCIIITIVNMIQPVLIVDTDFFCCSVYIGDDREIA